MHNPDFNLYGIAGIKTRTGSNTFYCSVSNLVQGTNVVGIVSKAGRYSGIYAHKDIALNFGIGSARRSCCTSFAIQLLTDVLQSQNQFSHR